MVEDLGGVVAEEGGGGNVVELGSVTSISCLAEQRYRRIVLLQDQN